MKDRLQKIRNEAIAQIKAAGGMDALNDIRVSFLGKRRTDSHYEIHERYPA